MSGRPFASILDSLTRQRWVTAALVVSERDGIVVESNLQIGQSGDRVAALAASLYRKARLSAKARPTLYRRVRSGCTLERSQSLDHSSAG